MSIIDYAEKNREAWNEVAPIHRQQRQIDLRKEVQAPAFCVLTDVEKALFEKIGLTGKRVAHFCCNNGRELISIVKMGAASGVGFDIADEVVKEAQELAELGSVDCTFVRTNIYDIPETYNAQFDIVYISTGALTWIDDLNRFFSKAANVLNDEGYMVMYEIHPFLDIMALPGEEEYDAQDELKIAYSYFKDEPYVDDNGLDYIGKTMYKGKTSYSFAHTVSDVLTSLIANQFALLHVHEYPDDISASFQHLEKYQKLPMSYSVVAQKMTTLPLYGKSERLYHSWQSTGVKCQTPSNSIG